MPSRVAKGRYHALRVRDWLRGLGFEVELLERRQVIRPDGPEGRVLWRVSDLWGADLLARNEEFLVFVQVKTNPGDVSKGFKELSRGQWPRSNEIKRWVVLCREGWRAKEGPEIHEVGEET